MGNVTGSNAVNVFLGLGLPWVIATIWKVSEGQRYVVPAGALGFSTVVFLCCALICLGTLCCRRAIVGGELGGTKKGQWATFALFLSLWLIYIIFSSMQAMGFIANPFASTEGIAFGNSGGIV